MEREAHKTLAEHDEEEEEAMQTEQMAVQTSAEIGTWVQSAHWLLLYHCLLILAVEAALVFA